MPLAKTTTTHWLPLVASVGVHGVALVAMVAAVGFATASDSDEAALQAQNVTFVETTAEEMPAPELELMPEQDAVDTLELEPIEAPELTPEEECDLPEVDCEHDLQDVPPLLTPHEIPFAKVTRRTPQATPPPAPPVARTPRTPVRTVSRPAPAKPQAARTKLKLVSRPNLMRYYPEQARRNGIEGSALVEIRVDTRGTVVDAKVVRSSGSELLDRQALRVLYAYRFAPGAGGKARVPVSFRLR